MTNVIYAHFSADNICRPTDDFHGTCSHLQITSPKILIELDRDFSFVKFHCLKEHDALYI